MTLLDIDAWIARERAACAPTTFVATDSGRSIPVSDPPFAVTVSASASDLVLLLHKRISPDDVHVDGDRTILEGFLEPVE